MRFHRFLLPALAAAAVFAAGCASPGTSEPVATTEVEMVKSYRFDPKVIEIEAGQTVTWTNEDNFTHTVQVDGQEDHKVGQDESVSITFDTPAPTTTSARSTARTWTARRSSSDPGRAQGRRRHPRLRRQRRHPRALTPGHFDDGTGAGLGFAAATILLTAFVIWLTRRPTSASGLVAAAVVFVGLLASYPLATTTGLPLLHPDPEPVDGLALATKAIEAVGLLAASSLLWRPVALTLRQPKGTLT